MQRKQKNQANSIKVLGPHKNIVTNWSQL